MLFPSNIPHLDRTCLQFNCTYVYCISFLQKSEKKLTTFKHSTPTFGIKVKLKFSNITPIIFEHLSS